jgi:hypothetical protein
MQPRSQSQWLFFFVRCDFEIMTVGLTCPWHKNWFPKNLHGQPETSLFHINHIHEAQDEECRIIVGNPFIEALW